MQTSRNKDIKNQDFRTLLNLSGKQSGKILNNQVLEILASEGREDFRKYIESTGVAKEKNMVVLSSLHNYYYDADEMKDVSTVVNLKEFNHIKNIKNFLHSIFHILPQKSNFIGCFVDNDGSKNLDIINRFSVYRRNKSIREIESGISSRFSLINRVYDLMDSRTNKHLSKDSVRLLLEGHGFSVRNMTDINGLTYFLAQKGRATENGAA